MKEDLFNILAPMINGALFLDLYCGSGAIGIEALSRGAKAAVFVDSSKEAANVTAANLRKARLEDKAEVLHMRVEHAYEKLAGSKFDIIFMDPPYDSGVIWTNLPCNMLVVECPLDAQLGTVRNIGTDIQSVAAQSVGTDIQSVTGRIVETDIQSVAARCVCVPSRQKKYAQMQFLFYEKGREGK